MNGHELAQGFKTLNELAKTEYHLDLQQLLSETTKSPQADPSLQIGRLVGVMLKEPFANPNDLKHPSHHSGAYRSWDLVNEAEFNERGEGLATGGSRNPHSRDWWAKCLCACARRSL
jgi:hypothetical protein